METINKYWKGLDELHHEPEFEKHRNNEFAEKLPLSKVLKEDDLELSSNRRDFLKFMGFGITAATLAACSRSPVRNVVPYANKPVEIEPGAANYYATTCGGCNARCSLLVKTREGRPIKIEGNADSPFSKGGTCSIGQGTVLSLYDLGRLSHPVVNKKAADWKAVDAAAAAAITSGGAIRLLTGTISSPSTKAAIETFIRKYPNTKHIQYDASSNGSAIIEAHDEAFGKAVLPSYNFEKAKSLLSIDADFLATWLSPVEFTKQYTASRKVLDATKPDDFLFHFQFESTLSLSGANADHRATLSPSQIGATLVRLHNYIADATGGSQAGSSSLELAGNSIKLAATHLAKNKGKALVICGSNNPDHQLIVASINHMLGAYGNTIDIDNPSYQYAGSDKDMINLVNEMNGGTVGTLIIHDCNPSYTYPDAKKFNAGLAKVKTSISFSTKLDETAENCTVVAPTNHFLESWGDDMPKAGYVSLYQPTISPIFNTRSTEESLLSWAGVTATHDEFVMKFWKENFYSGGSEYKNFEDFWMHSLEKGFISMPTKEARAYSFSGNVSAAAGKATSGSADDIEVVIYEKIAIRDGKDANNPWLQEVPDPISKVSWDNYAAISPKLAEKLGLNDEDVVEIKAKGSNYSVKLPVLKQPGQKYNTVGIAKGYGHSAKESATYKVANGVGANAFPFATITDNAIIYGGQVITITKTGETYPLAQSQTHHNMEGRDLVRETTIAEVANGNFYKEQEEKQKEANSLRISLWQDYRYPGHQWGMAVDLNACTGCNACVVSCQAENNVPVVGKDEVRRRREMHWIRIDRYYSVAEEGPKEVYHDKYKEIDKLEAEHKLGNYERVKVVFQPIMCQQCSNAPCETVCPVNAISHSSEGLNQQAYNRCVGTRYCANNCPYKVRRFNWFNYALNDKFKDYALQTDLGRMVLNPDVTVRTRGVMEKCTFCVQRIQVGKLDAKKEGRSLKDGEIKTACQQTCPANAIVFGDMNDPNSEISKLLENKRTYKILTELNVRPSVSYMSKVRNSTETIA